MTEPASCPGCGHSLAKEVHDPRDGCLAGWEWDDDTGIATVDGCRCDLTVAGQCR